MTIKKFIPRQSQLNDLAFAIKEKKSGFLHDPGVGKTLPACLYIYYLWKMENTKSYFVMPKSLLRKNRMELLQCTNFEEDEIQIVDGSPAKRVEQMNNKKAKVFLMGFKRFADDWKTMKDIHPELGAVVGDEWHMGFKGHKSKRTKELMKCYLGPYYFKFLLIMSGTLIDGRLDSCYPAIKLIEPRYYTNHNSFMAQHAYTDSFGRVLSWYNHEKLGRIFIRHCMRRTFEQEYGKQKIVSQREICEMHPKQRAAYSEFEEQAILELEDSFLEGFNPAVASIRCRQIMAHPQTFGILKDDEPTGKEESLEVHLEDHLGRNEPILIYSVLQPEQERLANLCKSKGFNVGLINGNVSAEKRSDIDLKFQKGEINCVVASPETAAVGFNWGHIDHIVFVSLDYKNVNFVQAYRRAIRGKRTKPLRITILEYENSLDQRIFQIVKNKSKDLNKVDSTYEILDFDEVDES